MRSICPKILVYWRSVPVRRNNKHKGPEVGIYLYVQYGWS